MSTDGITHWPKMAIAVKTLHVEALVDYRLLQERPAIMPDNSPSPDAIISPAAQADLEAVAAMYAPGYVKPVARSYEPLDDESEALNKATRAVPSDTPERLRGKPLRVGDKIPVDVIAALEADMSEITQKRRLRIYWISDRELLSAFRRLAHVSHDFVSLPLCEGIPCGAELLSVWHDPMTRAFRFAVYHDSFDEVAAGCEAPLWPGINAMVETFRIERRPGECPSVIVEE